jgi:putative peptidoglycan lipid II flippase
LLAEPLARLLFERHNFTSADTARAAAMIAWYATGVWAYCAAPVLVRAFYAIGDRATPVRIGLAAVAVNFALNIVLIWPLGETALAVSTSLAAMLQVVLLTVRLARAGCPLEWPRLSGTFGRTLAATATMALAVIGCLALVPKSLGAADAVARVALPLAAGAASYLVAIHLLGGAELRMLLGRQPELPSVEPRPATESLNWQPPSELRPAARQVAGSIRRP